MNLLKLLRHNAATRRKPAFGPSLPVIATLAYTLLQTVPLLAQDIWTGGAGTTNWTDGGNWSGGTPISSSPVFFDNVNATVGPAVVDNIVDADFTIFSLAYQTVSSASTSGFHTTQINPGLSLNINGSGDNALFVGTGLASVGAVNIYSRFLGGGTLTVTNASGALFVEQGGDNNDHYATLDLSGLTNFAASVTQIFIGCTTNITTGISIGQRPMGIIRLAETNFIQTAATGTNQPGIMVASYPTGDTALRGTQQLFLGRYNVINSDAISVGGTKSTGQILFRPGLAGGFASLRGSAGGSDKVKWITIGDERAGMTDFRQGGTSVGCSGTMDATGNILDVLVQDLYVARSQTNNSGNATGVLTFDQGTITADNVYVGYHHGPPFGPTFPATAIGTVNVNGTATLAVNNDLMLSRKLGTNNPVANLNISSNGTVSVRGNLVTSNGTSTVTFNGGTINMQPLGDATPGNVTIGTLTGSGGTITNAANVTNSVALNPGGTFTVGTLSIAGNFYLGTNATLTFNLTNDTTAGSGLNDLINITGNLNLASNLVTFIPMASTLASGSYRLFNYTGTRAGILNFINPTHYTATIDYSTPNQVNAVVSGSPATVRWNSSTSTLWDAGTSNWFNTGTSVIDKFGQLDNALVDESGVYTNFLSLSTILFPNSVTVNSATRNYIFGGAGRISGTGSLTKQGASTLTISNANDFTGTTTISGGILRTLNATALGTTNGGTTITSGGALDLFGTSLFSPGEFFTIAGNGPTNGGAIMNSGAAQNNGVRFVSLTADSSVGTWPNRFDVRGPGGSGSFSGGLYLNGFTLTKLGPAQLSLVDSIATNAGSLVVAGGTLSFTRSMIDGPGYVDVLTNTLLFENSSTGYLAKPISVTTGTIRVVGNAFSLGVPITNLAGLTIDNSVALTLSNAISGAGALTKSSAGNLTLLGANTYSGPTAITGGRVTLGATGSIATTPSIALSAGTILDVSAIAGFALGAGETISGSGGVIGDVTATAANTFIPGDGPATLSFSNNLAMNSSTNIIELGSDPTQIGANFNDLISVSGNLTLSGVTTLKIAPIGPLSVATPYTVLTYAGTLLSGGLANLQVVSDNPRYTFTVVDPASTPGSIQVSVAGTPPILLWNGGQPSNPRAWDTTTSNWLNGALSDRFFAGDSVQFDNTATTNVVSVIATVQPGAVTVSNNVAAYNFGGPGAITGGSLTKLEVSALTFTNSGGVGFSAGMTLNNGPVIFANGSTNTFGGSVVVNAGPVTFTNNGPDNIPSGLTVNADAVTFANPAVNSFGPAITLNGGTLTFKQPLDVTLGTPIANAVPSTAGGLIKQANTTLTLSGNNSTFDGPITVSAGTLKAGNNNALGNANGDTTIASGATLDISGFSLYNPGDIINIAGTGLSSTGAVINTGAAQNNAVRALNLTGNATIAAWSTRWDVRGPGGSGSHSGALNLNGFTLTKLGASTNSVVDCAPVSDGAIEILAGTLSLTRTEVGGLGRINVSSNLLNFENFSTADPVVKPIVVSGGTIRVIGNSLTVGSPITNLLPGVTVDVASGQTLTESGTISGTGSVAKVTAGTLILTAPDSTWGGSTTIAAGTLQIGSGIADGSLPDLPTTNNGTLLLNSLSSFTITNQISGSGALTLQPGHLTLGGSNSFTGATLINSTTVTDPAGGVLTISNSFALGTAAGNTHIVGNTTGNGRLELLGNINVPEPLLVDCRQAGTINLPAVLNVSGSNTISGAITGSTGGSDMNFQSDSGKLTMSGGFNCTTTSGTRRLKLMGDGFGEWSGIISNSTDGLVNTILIKTNSGRWTLSAANIYNGNTTIGGGTLALAGSGSINSSPTIDVQSGAVFDVAAVSGGYALGASQTLKGNGSVAGNITANGNVTPGASIGTLSFSHSLVLAGTITMEIDRDAVPNADLLIANSLTYGGSLVVNNIGAALQNGDTFNLFDWTTRSGSFASITLPALDTPLTWDTSTLSVDGIIKVSSGGFSTTRTNLTIFVTGNSLDISWPLDHTGWRLESQTNSIKVGLTATWYTVPNSTTTNHMVIPRVATNAAVFYRMANP